MNKLITTIILSTVLYGNLLAQLSPDDPWYLKVDDIVFSHQHDVRVSYDYGSLYTEKQWGDEIILAIMDYHYPEFWAGWWGNGLIISPPDFDYCCDHTTYVNVFGFADFNLTCKGYGLRLNWDRYGEVWSYPKISLHNSQSDVTYDIISPDNQIVASISAGHGYEAYEFGREEGIEFDYGTYILRATCNKCNKSISQATTFIRPVVEDTGLYSLPLSLYNNTITIWNPQKYVTYNLYRDGRYLSRIEAGDEAVRFEVSEPGIYTVKATFRDWELDMSNSVEYRTGDIYDTERHLEYSGSSVMTVDKNGATVNVTCRRLSDLSVASLDYRNIDNIKIRLSSYDDNYCHFTIEVAMNPEVSQKTNTIPFINIAGSDSKLQIRQPGYGDIEVYDFNMWQENVGREDYFMTLSGSQEYLPYYLKNEYTGTSRLIFQGSGSTHEWEDWDLSPGIYYLCVIIEGRGEFPMNGKYSFHLGRKKSPGNSITTRYMPSATECFYDITYYDGLGYPKQMVSSGASPQGYSVNTPIYYDALRRDNARAYLPYVSTLMTGETDLTEERFNKQDNFYTGLFPGESEAYMENIFDPLDRIVKTYKPGAAYTEDTGFYIYVQYSGNASEEVRLLQTSDDGKELYVNSPNYYSVNQLFKERISDEDDNITETFSDKDGRIVLTRAQINHDGGPVLYADTYYIYDRRGNLSWIVSPKGSEELTNNFSVLNTSDFCNKYCYNYIYDNYGRVIEKREPGKEKVLFVYDKADRIVMMQDGTLRNSGKWHLTRYDIHGRELEVFIVPNSQSRETLQALFDGDNTGNLYTNANRVVLRESAYGVYPDIAGLEFEPIPEIVSSSDVESVPRSLLTSVKHYVLEGTTQDYSQELFYYDYKRRVIQTVKRNHLGGISRHSYKYNMVDDVLAEHETHSVSNGGGNDMVYRYYTRDHRGRLLKEETILNQNDPVIVEYSYDELSQLSQKRFGNAPNAPLQVNSYNIQGNLKTMTSNFFDLDLRYYDPTPNLIADPSYSGNITEMIWRHKGSNADNTSLQRYGFSYDGINRLKGSNYISGSSEISQRSFTERDIRYDSNGNITALKRYGQTDLDNDFIYTYYGNILTGLTDNVRGSAQVFTYEYDANGNTVKDGMNGLDLSYNYLNLISVVRDSKSSTKPVKARYNWLSDGTKIGVRTYDASGNLSGGNEYLGSFIYDRNGNEPVLESVAFSEGMIQVSGGAAQVNYFIRDHLGSPRVVFNKEGTVLSRNDFYPFGQRWETPNPLGKKNRWLYNGKENQSGFGLPYTDYGSRMYDSKLVRWHGIDLLAAKYPGISPFVYCLNNPLMFIDPDGQQPRSKTRYMGSVSMGWGPQYGFKIELLGALELGASIKKWNFEAKSEISLEHVSDNGLNIEASHDSKIIDTQAGAEAGVAYISTGIEYEKSHSSSDHPVFTETKVTKTKGMIKTEKGTDKYGNKYEMEKTGKSLKVEINAYVVGIAFEIGFEHQEIEPIKQKNFNNDNKK